MAAKQKELKKREEKKVVYSIGLKEVEINIDESTKKILGYRIELGDGDDGVFTGKTSSSFTKIKDTQRTFDSLVAKIDELLEDGYTFKL